MAEQFIQTLSRVYTFKAGSWPYIQDKHLNPYNLASYGYMITKPFVLQCFVCHHQIILPQQFDADFTDTIQTLSNHKPNCIYHGQDYHQLVAKETVPKEAIYLMMDQIMAPIKQSLSCLNEDKKYPVLDKNQVQNSLAEDSFTFRSIDQGYKLNWPQTIKISFFLQFFGWTIKKSTQNLKKFHAECFFCGRNVNLNTVKFIEKDEQQNNAEYSEEQSFNPVSQHRYFCLWVNPSCSGYKGYSIYIQHLFDKMNQSKSLFSKRPPEETKKIRVEMDKYLQSFQQKTSEQFDKIKAIFNQCENMEEQIIHEGQEVQKQSLFKQSQKNMREFTNNFIGQEIKQAVKKIKLN